MFGIEDQLTTVLTSAITFAAGWLLDNKVPRKWPSGSLDWCGSPSNNKGI